MTKQQPRSSKPLSKTAAKVLFARLVREAPNLNRAWAEVRKAFPRKRWGKVREITRVLSEHQTFTAAFAAAHSRARRVASRQ